MNPASSAAKASSTAEPGKRHTTPGPAAPGLQHGSRAYGTAAGPTVCPMTGEVAPRGHDDELRVSHEDRDRVVEQLRTAAGDGRLTAEELDQRIEAALAAITYGDLAPLTRDLPSTAGQGGLAPRPEPKDLVRIDCHSGAAKRDGGWVVPKRIEVRVTSGGVTLDFTKAVIAQPSLEIDAEVRSGSLTLVTRPGVVVDADEVAVRSGTVKVKAPWGADVPAVLRVHVSGKVGSGSLKARPPRRTFWQWLLRRPLTYD
jgi:hypothetical protein